MVRAASSGFNRRPNGIFASAAASQSRPPLW